MPQCTQLRPASIAPTAVAPVAVVVVGPAPPMTGGMASVVTQTMGLCYDGRYLPELFRITVSADPSEALGRRAGRHLRRLRDLKRTIRGVDAGIVHIHTCSGFSFFRSGLDARIARRSGCRVLLHIHGAYFDEFFRDLDVVRRRVASAILAGADAVIALSAGWRDKLERMSPSANVVVVENAVDVPPFSPSHAHDGPVRFLLLARMDKIKGIDDLLDACAFLRRDGVEFDVVLAGPSGSAGDGPVLMGKIRERRLDGCVRCVGEVHGEKKRELFRWADVYVQPSHHEGMPISMLEALAAGLPVVSTAVGSVPEVLADDESGILVPAREPDKLAAAMASIAADADRRAAASRSAHALALRRFPQKRLEADLVRVYDAVMNRSRLHRLRPRT